LLIQAAGIALAILGGRNDKIRDNRRLSFPKISSVQIRAMK
jgi:hypothetical protein